MSKSAVIATLESLSATKPKTQEYHAKMSAAHTEVHDMINSKMKDILKRGRKPMDPDYDALHELKSYHDKQAIKHGSKVTDRKALFK